MNGTTKQTTRAPWDNRPRVTKADITTPNDSGKTVEQLQAEIDQGGRGGTQGPARRTVPRSAIHVAENVFQWRNPRSDKWTRREHIYKLAKVLRESGEPLEPLLVLPVGESFYVMDGHHRLAAYDTAGWTKGIPVEVFEGSLDAARVRALESNVKDKLMMSTTEKSEAAWKIIKEKLGGLKAEEVFRLTGVSIRQVKYMRKAWRELNAREGLNRDGLMKMPWTDAGPLWKHGLTPDHGDFDQETYKEKKVLELLNQMERHNILAGLSDPEVTAAALQRLHSGLPEALIEQWASDYPELIEELAARIADPSPDLDF